MKKYLLAILMVLMYASISQSAIVSKIVGLASECDTNNSGCSTIPLSLTTLCTVTCPQQTSFSFTDSSRFWGWNGGVGACVTSTDGGASWGACTSQPFTTGNREFYAGTPDGGVIAAGTPTGPNTCTIRKSTNNGTSWTTVFTEVIQCTGGSIEGQRLFCISNGNCEFLGSDASSAKIYRSSNNGDSWTAGETAVAANCALPGGAWDGSAGIMPSQLTGCGGGGIARTYVAAGDSWTQSTTWDGTQGDCWGPVVYNGVGRVTCQVGASALTLRSSTGVLVATLTLPNSVQLIDSGGVALSPFTNVMYVFAQRVSPAAAVAAWVSRDNLASFVNIGAFTGGGAGIRGGNTFYANGCIYITGGSTSMFGKIC